jgi:putative component of membrane protein insertase Oxa1/YidC/SpoIIIJ protein YidD
MRGWPINVLIFCAGLITSQAQTWEGDWQRLQGTLKPQPVPREGVLAAQIQATTFFSDQNWEFGKSAIREWGMFKGSFLFIDRVLRSNRLYATQVYPARLNAANRIRDPASAYTLRKP